MQSGGAFSSMIQYCTWACLGPKCLCLDEGVAGATDSLRSSPEKKKYIKRVGSLIVEHFTPQRPGDGLHRHIIGSVVVLS